MATKFRKVDPRIWRDEKFSALSEEEKLVFLYCITAQANRIGLFNFSPALAAEDLGTLPQTFLKRFLTVCEMFGWGYDATLRVLFIPTWWKHNPPENGNVLKGCLSDLSDIPQTPLIARFYDATRKIAETFGVTLPQTIPQTLPNSGAGAGAGAGAGKKAGGEPAADTSQQSKNRPTAKAEDVPIPERLDTAEFRATWSEWLADRKARGKVVTERAARQQLAALSTLDPIKAAACIQQSIANGWTGLFPERFQGSGNGGRAPTSKAEANDDYAAQMFQDAFGEPP